MVDFGIALRVDGAAGCARPESVSVVDARDELDRQAVARDEEEPVAAPRDVAHDCAEPRRPSTATSLRDAAARHVRHARPSRRRAASRVDRRRPAFRCACAPGRNPPEVGQRRDHADRAVAAHAEVADVVEEDHAGAQSASLRRAEQARRPARRSPRGSLTTAERKRSCSARKRARRSASGPLPRSGPPSDDDARRLAAGVRIDHPHAPHRAARHQSAFGIAPVKFSGPRSVTCTESSMRTPPTSMCASTSPQSTAFSYCARRAGSRNKYGMK